MSHRPSPSSDADGLSGGEASGLSGPDQAPAVLLSRRLLLAGSATSVLLGAWPRSGSAAALRSFYVSTAGSDSSAGTMASPWRTIGRALRAGLRAGDEVVVGDGTYTEQIIVTSGGNAATATGYVTLRSSRPGGALLRSPSGGYSTVSVRASYVIVDGFDIVGGSGHGVDVENAHHVQVLNNIVHDSGGSGIQFNYSEWITVSGNVCFRNAGRNGYQCSGISIYQARNITGNGAGSGFRVVVRGNISYSNVEYISGETTDGNGIIIDDFQSTQNSSYSAYPFTTLVENNLTHSNGGKGIQVTWSDLVTVRNNTSWLNNIDNHNPGTWRGELNNQQSSNNLWINNIAVANPSTNPNNTAIGNYSYGGYINRNTAWYNNLTYNGRVGQSSLGVSSGNQTPSATNGNKLGVDPLFVTPAATNFDFRVRSGSPAIGAGTVAYGAPTTDLAGVARPTSGLTIGAYEAGTRGAATTPPTGTGVTGIWSMAALPAISSDSDTQSVELGVKFKVTKTVVVKGMRFYKGTGNNGTHYGTLWTSGGQRLATVTFANESATGWQQMLFASTVTLSPGVVYIVSYFAPQGRYAITQNFFVSPITSGDFVVPTSDQIGGNGVYRYGSPGLPTNTWRAANYWVDVVRV